MYKKEFDNLLKNQIPKATLLYGDNSFYFDYYTLLYKNKLNVKETLLEHFYDDYNFEVAKDYLSQSSLFGDFNLYILRTDKKIPKNEIDILISNCKRNPKNYFLYIYEGSSSNAKSLQNIFSKNSSIWVRFFEANIKEAIEFTKSQVKELKIDISYSAITHLVNLLNANMALLNNELNKLAILNKEITIRDIDSLVYSTAPLAIENMIISLFNKEDITQTLSKLIELGEDEFSILRSIQRFINQLFLFSAYIKLNGKVDSKEILGYKLPKHIEEQRASIAIKIKSNKLLEIYEELLNIEIEIKQSKGNKETLLYGSLIKIRNLL